jgi:hypothetical protein
MEAALTLNDWIRSLNDGGLAPSSDQLVNSIKQYYSEPTPENYNINDKIEALFRVSEINICDLRAIFSRLFLEKERGILDERSTTQRVKAIVKFEANSNKNEINFTFIDKLITIMQILRRRQQGQQQQQQQRGDSDESSCVLQGGRIRRQMKKKSKRVKVNRSTRRRLSKRHSHHKK